MTIEVTKVDQINCEPNSLMISPLIQSDSSTYVEPHISVVLGTEKGFSIIRIWWNFISRDLNRKVVLFKSLLGSHE